MTKDELKALYEKYPWAWERQQLGKTSREWVTVEYFPTISLGLRLKPRLPADLPEPTEDMMNRAVPLGADVKLPQGVNGFRGWRVVMPSKGWEYTECVTLPTPNRFYCIDVTDPNADAIIMLNLVAKQDRPEEEVTGPTQPPTADEVLDHLYHQRINEAKMASLSANPKVWAMGHVLQLIAQGIQEAKQALDNQLPADPEWVTLDECEIEFKGGGPGGGWCQMLGKPGGNEEEAAIHLIKHGPASVRIRKKT